MKCLPGKSRDLLDYGNGVPRFGYMIKMVPNSMGNRGLDAGLAFKKPVMLTEFIGQNSDQ